MNRIEIVGLFSAIKKLLDMKEYDKVNEIVDDILLEAREKSSKSKKAKEENNG